MCEYNVTTNSRLALPTHLLTQFDSVQSMFGMSGLVMSPSTMVEIVTMAGPVSVIIGTIHNRRAWTQPRFLGKLVRGSLAVTTEEWAGLPQCMYGRMWVCTTATMLECAPMYVQYSAGLPQTHVWKSSWSIKCNTHSWYYCLGGFTKRKLSRIQNCFLIKYLESPNKLELDSSITIQLF